MTLESSCRYYWRTPSTPNRSQSAEHNVIDHAVTWGFPASAVCTSGTHSGRGLSTKGREQGAGHRQHGAGGPPPHPRWPPTPPSPYWGRALTLTYRVGSRVFLATAVDLQGREDRSSSSSKLVRKRDFYHFQIKDTRLYRVSDSSCHTQK